MKKILIATKNEGKFEELRTFLSDLPLNLISLSDLDIKEDVEENGKTYKENSRKKALFYAKISNLPTIADDGGIEIEALNFEPGIKTKRWFGRETSDKELIAHMKKVAKELLDNNRTAYFKAIVTFALPNGKYFQKYGEVKGIIAKKPLLKHLKGYPFRSFFYLTEIKKYYHEDQLSEKEEKLYNHRYKAVTKLKHIIIKEMGLV